MPATSSATTSSTQLVPSEPRAATQAKPSACRARPVTMIGRRPMRSEIAPANGETSIGVAKNGSSRSPAEIGEYPRANWNSWVIRNAAANVAPDMRNDVTVADRERPAAEQPQRHHRRVGPPLPPDERQQQRAPASSVPTVCGLDQPTSLARTRAQTSATTPAGDQGDPGQVQPLRRAVALRQQPHAERAASSPIGTLSQKIQCQSRPSVTAPPTSGPAATASPARPP